MQIWSHAQKFFIWISEKWKVKDVVQFIVDTMYEESMVQEMNDQEGFDQLEYPSTDLITSKRLLEELGLEHYWNSDS